MMYRNSEITLHLTWFYIENSNHPILIKPRNELVDFYIYFYTIQVLYIGTNVKIHVIIFNESNTTILILKSFRAK